MTDPMTDPQPVRQRVLYLTKVDPHPPAVTGDAVYSRGIIEAWAGVADLTVLCAESGADSNDRARTVSWVIADRQRTGRAGSVASRFPLISWKGATPGYVAELDRLLGEPGWDVIVLDNIGLAHALPRAEAYRAAHPATRLVYVSHEWEFTTRMAKYAQYGMGLAKRVMAQWDLRKVRRWEEALISRTDVVTVINSSDLVPFREIDPSRKFLVLTPGYNGPVSRQRTISDAVPRRVLVLGGRRSEQKQQVLLDWLAVSHDRLLAAGIETAVVGDIPDELRTRVAADYPSVDVIGFAPDLDAVISTARAGLVVDTVGSGFKIRLLSQVFQRLPIVGLSSAIDGLPTSEGAGYLAAPTLEEVVDLVCSVVDDPDRLDAVQQRAFEDCESEFSWEARAEMLSALAGPTAQQVLL